MGKAARSGCLSPHRPTFTKRLSDRLSSVSYKRQPKTPEKCSRRNSCQHEGCSQARNPPRIALQNIDFAEDAVVITALDTVPFCCHEDLLSMSRSQMVSAAQSLNQKLPFVLHIDTSDARSDSFIRNSIELVVGIRPQQEPVQTPPSSATPRVVTSPYSPSRAVYSSPRAVTSPYSPTRSTISSPLPKRSRYSSITMVMTPPLAILNEEEEAESSFLDDRPPKRRRTTADRLRMLGSAPSTPTRARIRHSASPYTPARRTRLAFGTEPLPSLSTQSLLAFSTLGSRQLANDSDLSLDIQSEMDTTF